MLMLACAANMYRLAAQFASEGRNAESVQRALESAQWYDAQAQAQARGRKA
jgi:hypothetical protein